MRYPIKTILILISLPLISESIIAQTIPHHFDSVLILKTKKTRWNYSFPDQEIQSITLKQKLDIYNPRSFGERFGSFVGDNLMYNFGSILGSISSSRNVVCLVTGKLISDNQEQNWDIQFICPAENYTSKELEWGSGGDMLSTTSFISIDWEAGTSGWILELNDTIGKFEIHSDPRTNSKFSMWSDSIFSRRPHRYKVAQKRILDLSIENLEQFYDDFAVVGQLRGKPFTIVFNGDLSESWFFEDNNLIMIFYQDIDEMARNLKQDTRILPYILLETKQYKEPTSDMIRMVMMTRFLTRAFSMPYINQTDILY